jgi:DNA-binding CsgD family transcriptional regulator
VTRRRLAAAYGNGVSSLIGEIYDAALDPSLWVPVLHKARALIGGCAAALFSKDATKKCLNVCYDDGGLDPHYKQLYFDKYATLDPSTIGHLFSEIERPVSIADLLPYDEFRETRFNKEWARPQGLVDFVGVALDKSATGVAMFGVFRHERDGRVDNETRRRMRSIVPHIRRALLIGRMIDFKGDQAATFEGVLDAVSVGMFLLDETGRMVHANAAGVAMLAQGCVLRSAHGKLAANNASATQALHDVVATASSDDTAGGRRGIAVPLTARDGKRYIAHALPLLSAARRRAAATSGAVAALFVRTATLRIPPAPEVIAKTFNLTPTELRVLLGIVEKGRVSDTADALGISQATVKTHLHRLFRKTGTARQADLVRLVAEFADPLVG